MTDLLLLSSILALPAAAFFACVLSNRWNAMRTAADELYEIRAAIRRDEWSGEE